MKSGFKWLNGKFCFQRSYLFSRLSFGVAIAFGYLYHNYNRRNDKRHFGWYPTLDSIYCKMNEESFIDIEEVKRHNKQSTDGFWTIYKNKVYDITEFVEIHPGGEIIMEAVGGYLDPFFSEYKFHNQPEVFEYLDSMAIGFIDENFTYDNVEKIHDMEQKNDYQHEPQRSPLLKVVSEKPFNAETPIELLDQNFLTDSNLFYARSHHPIPSIDKHYHTIEVCYENEFLNEMRLAEHPKFYPKKDHRGRECNCRNYTLDELKSSFKPHQITASLQCAGNRRKEMNDVEPVKGLQWDGGAIGNALWGGYRVREILLHDNIFDDDLQGTYHNDITGHLIMRGADKSSHSNEQYETSIPLNKALDSDTLVAISMNNNELPREHGYPARVIVPGVCGARSVKWLQSITVSSVESEARWQKQDYKIVPSSIKFGDKVDMSKYAAIQGTPVTSFICNPKNDSRLKISLAENTLNVSGYAFSGNGDAIKSVEVSVDGGKNWISAQLNSICDNQRSSRCWSWTLWNVKVPLSDSADKVDIIARCTDWSNNTQPHTPHDIWNMRGLLNNARNHSQVYIERVA